MPVTRKKGLPPLVMPTDAAAIARKMASAARSTADKLGSGYVRSRKSAALGSGYVYMGHSRTEPAS